MRRRRKWQILISPAPLSEIQRIRGWPDTLTLKVGKDSEALVRALGAVVEGLTFYDLANAAVAEVECYVCGFVADTKAMPNVCPSCGAARYAFEKEIALTKAWEIASETERHSAVLFRESAARAAGPARSLLEELAKEDESQATLADRQLAEL